MQEQPDKGRILRSGFLLMGALFAAHNIASFLHEAGHVLGAWCTGGDASRIVIHPFSWSYAHAFSFNHEGVVIWAGSVLGSLFGIPITLAVLKWRRPGLLIPLLVGVVACIYNGAYLLLGCLFKLGGDGTVLAAEYAPAAAVAAAGLLMVCIGMRLAVPLIPVLGFRLEDRIVHRMVVLSIGILPYEFITLVYQAVTDIKGIGFWLSSAAASFAFVFLFSFLSFWLQHRLPVLKKAPAVKISKGAVLANNAFALLLLAVLLLQLTFTKADPWGFLEDRPEEFPEELTAPPYAEEISYSTRSFGFITIGYTVNMEREHSFEEVRTFIHAHLQNHGYQKLKYDILDPNEMMPEDWTCIPTETGPDGNPTEQICMIPEHWLNLGGQSPRHIIVSYTHWIQPGLDKPTVIHVMNLYRQMEWPKVRDYLNQCAQRYPQEFNLRDFIRDDPNFPASEK
jgi:hypothetical protein